MKTKICPICEKEKELSEFYKAGKDNKYYQRKCKQCNIDNNKTWSGRNKEKVKEYRDVWRKRNHNTIKVKSQEILDGMRRRSKQKGFGIPQFTKSEIERIITDGKCAITGIPFEFDQSVYTKSPWTPSPDRINSTKGYTKKNVQWVCYIYNAMKNEFSAGIIKRFIDAVYNNLHKL